MRDSASFQGSWDRTAPWRRQLAQALAPPAFRGAPGLLLGPRGERWEEPRNGVGVASPRGKGGWREVAGGQCTYWPQGPRAAFLFSGLTIMEVTLTHSWAQPGPQKGTSGGQWASGVGSTWAQRCPMNTHLLGSAHTCAEARLEPARSRPHPGRARRPGMRAKDQGWGSWLGEGMDSGFWVTARRGAVHMNSLSTPS